MKKNTSSDSNAPFACLNCPRSCLIKEELTSLHENAINASEYNAQLANFVRQLFECLRRMVQSREIEDTESLGIALGSIFDWCVSLLYAEKVANTGWLYCPDAQMSFYPYIKSCPVCGRVENIEPRVHKPSSDTIGRYTTICLGTILSEICRVSQNKFAVKILPTSRGDIDMLIFDSTTAVLCEVKSSPLYLFPLCVRYEKPLKTFSGVEVSELTTHEIVAVDAIESRELYLFLAGGYLIPVRLVSEVASQFLSLEDSRNPDRLYEMLDTVRGTWASMYAGYTSRWRVNSDLRWLTCGCGGSVDDSKNAPGLDRTDDIKKGIYQMLKISAKYSRGCQERRIRTALLSNMHPVTHYEEYLRDFEDALWTRGKDIQERSGQTVLVEGNNLLPFYDMLLTLTRSWFRDERLEQAFSLRTLLLALGGTP
ncbi:MAG: hypothetical protein ACUVR1_07855 [Fimbriimonadales bacterium]